MSAELMERPVTVIMSPEDLAVMVEKEPPGKMCVCHTCGKIGLFEGRIRFTVHCICCYGAVR